MKEKIEIFAKLVEKQQKERVARDYPRIPQWSIDIDCKTHIKPGKKYTKVDVGTSGKFMIDAEGNIFGIKAYGVIHRGHRYGTLDTINNYYWGNYSPVKLN